MAAADIDDRLPAVVVVDGDAGDRSGLVHGLSLAVQPVDGDGDTPFAVIGVGSDEAVVRAAADGRVGALALIDPLLSAEALEILAEWEDLPVLAVADPARRASLRGAVDAYLASPHAESDLWVRPVGEGPTPEEVAAWLTSRLAAAGRLLEVACLSSDGWELHGNLALPFRDSPAPGVLLLHSGRSDRYIYTRLERLLVRRGLVVLNLDWRGRGRSTNKGTYFELTAEERAAAGRDAAAGFDFLAARAEVDGQRLAAVGVAHGAEYAVRGSVGDDRLRALVVLSGFEPANDAERDRVSDPATDVLFVTAAEHKAATALMRDLYNRSSSRHSRFVEIAGGAIGYQMFELHEHLEPMIADWLDEVLEP